MTIQAFTGKYRFLSNFWPSVVYIDDGFPYPTVEHAYQASKTLIKEEREKIKKAESPFDAKKIGHSLSVRFDWNRIKLEVMTGLIDQKFAVSPLKEMLIATDPLEIIEGNYWGDTFWGICKGRGENHLGKILMEKRRNLMRSV